MKKNKEMENISFFLTGAEKYGVGKADLFQVSCLQQLWLKIYGNQSIFSQI